MRELETVQNQSKKPAGLYVKWYRSLTAKLFLLVSACLLLTVAGISWQNSTMFRDFLSRQLEDQTVAQAKKSTNAVESVVENWLSLTVFAMQDLSGRRRAEIERLVQRFLLASEDFVAFDVIRRDLRTKRLRREISQITGKDDLRFEDRLKAKLAGDIKAAVWKRVRSATASSPLLLNLEPDTGLALMALAIRFDNPGEGEVWAVVSTWQTKLLKSLPQTGNTTSYVRASNGALFGPSARKDHSMFAANLKPAANQSWGYRAFSKADGQQLVPYLGAFAKSPSLGLTTTVVRDATDSYLVIKKTILRTALWAWVYFIGFLMVAFLAARGLTGKLKRVTGATLQIASGDLETRIDPRGGDEVALLSHAVNHMAAQLQWFVHSQIARARQEKELETAKMVQSTFFPKTELDSPMLSLSGQTISASECGGDWWGHFKLRSGEEMIVIADVTGHGAAAALVTAMAFSCYQLMHGLAQSRESFDPSPSEILCQLNRMLFEAGGGKTSMTCVLVIIDPNSGRMRYINAGHNPPFILPASAEDPRIQRKRKRRVMHTTLKGSENLLGVLPEWSADEQEMTLQPGDKLLLYTDGIFECGNANGEVWGSKRFRAAIDEMRESSAEQLKMGLFEQAYQHFGGNPPDDDITLLVCEVDDSWTPTLQLTG